METLKYSVENNVGTLFLNRPQVRNAFNEAMIAEMTEFFESLHKDKDLRVLCLRGEGASFSAGADLNWMRSMVNFSKNENMIDSQKLFEMYQALQAVPVPVVSFVHGHAMGGALGLIAVSDIVFVVEGTQLCFSEVRLGLAPAVISAFVKDKIMPRDMSRYFLTAEVFGPEEAFSMGLVHEYGPEDKMQEKLQATVKKLRNNGPQAVRETKRLIADLNIEADIKTYTTQLIAQLRVGAEGQEGLQAFFEKRKPKWMES